ncbi:MAG TPA: hypothetical protein EYM97_02225 [Gemmatimonadetes bacterium]|nr:hypothetical protein [Gemmatimonadota bacterium]
MHRVTLVVAICSMLVGETATAQSPEAKVMAAIHQVFDGMRASDPAMVAAVFADNARFAVVRSKDSLPEISTQPVAEWIGAIGESGGSWDEQVYDMDVRIDDNVASAWVPYTFYLEGLISHCGVNSIELLRNGEHWEITQLSDTRRIENCPDPLGN